nr:uncharacterized protein LOC128704152 [Cherax quadricarinatus]
MHVLDPSVFAVKSVVGSRKVVMEAKECAESHASERSERRVLDVMTQTASVVDHIASPVRHLTTVLVYVWSLPAALILSQNTSAQEMTVCVATSAEPSLTVMKDMVCVDTTATITSTRLRKGVLTLTASAA